MAEWPPPRLTSYQKREQVIAPSTASWANMLLRQPVAVQRAARDAVFADLGGLFRGGCAVSAVRHWAKLRASGKHWLPDKADEVVICAAADAADDEEIKAQVLAELARPSRHGALHAVMADRTLPISDKVRVRLMGESFGALDRYRYALPYRSRMECDYRYAGDEARLHEPWERYDYEVQVESMGAEDRGWIDAVAARAVEPTAETVSTASSATLCELLRVPGAVHPLVTAEVLARPLLHCFAVRRHGGGRLGYFRQPGSETA